jgi:hypothetical protein
MSLNEIAEGYVKLVLAVGLYDPYLVDAYFGPEDWRPAPEKKGDAGYSLEDLEATCSTLVAACGRCIDEDSLRRTYLEKQLISLATKLRLLQGEQLSFDEESSGLYDAVLPAQNESIFAEAVQELGSMIPGSGPLGERYVELLKKFIIPADKVAAVFDAAVAEARKRTLEYISLPEQESFAIEYVVGQPWSAYNWFKGNAFSLIQVNTDLPIYINRPVGLACHEGYPGHHVFHSLLEEKLYKGKGWVEYLVNPLFSPQSMIAEGTANYGARLAFTREEQREFERSTLYPLAGLSVDLQDTLQGMRGPLKKLRYADNAISRRYLDGEVDRKEAIRWLEKFSLTTRERAEKRLEFVERYRSYVINYTLGEDLVRQYVESQAEGRTERWKVFTSLLTTPCVPSGLIVAES